MRTVNKQRAVRLLLLLLLTQAMCVQFSRSALSLCSSLSLSFAPAAYLMTIEIFSSCFFFRHCVAYLCLSTTDCSSRHNVATHSLALSHTHTLATLALAHVAVFLFILHLRESEQKRERERERELRSLAVTFYHWLLRRFCCCLVVVAVVVVVVTGRRRIFMAKRSHCRCCCRFLCSVNIKTQPARAARVVLSSSSSR